jgi:NACHT domain
VVGVEPVSGAAAKIATTIATTLVKRLLRRPEPGAGLVGDPVRLRHWLPRGGGQLDESQLRKLVDELVLRAGDADSQVRLLGPDRGQAVVTALVRTVLTLGELTLDDIVAARADPAELAYQLGETIPDATRDLDARQAILYTTLLAGCCRQIIEYFSTDEHFQKRIAVAQLGLLGTLADRIPDQAGEAARFEQALRELLVRKLDQDQLFGLQLPAAEQTYQVSTAYVSLTLQLDAPAAAPDSAARRTGLRLEGVLAERRKLVIEGAAGAGKSTLLRRLALHALRGDVPAELARWRHNVPFLLPLRSLYGNERLDLPLPEDFLARVADAIAGEAPDKWASGLMREGRAVVLADGIDEVPERHRGEVVAWLTRLAEGYQQADYVVTSRPAAMTDELRAALAAGGFVTARLEPMTRHQVDELVVRWHQAALARDAHAPGYVEGLRAALLKRRDLAQLATTPLLCAMMCALNRINNGYLPQGRASLYDHALTMLLEQREREQQVPAAPVPLSRDQLEPMLSRLAIWMTMNGRRNIPRPVARAEIADPLGRVRARGAGAALSAGEALDLLVQRSGLLQEPDPGLIEFRHPSFQDYLAAVEIFHRNHLEHLIRNMQDPLYHDVAIMAVGQTQRDPVRQRELLTRMIQRAESDREHGRQLWLLAAACVADVGMADRELADRIHRETRRLLPPTNMDEADAVARAGGFALDLLAEAALERQLTDRQSAATVRAAALIGGEQAAGLMHRFRHCAVEEVQRELVAAWYRSPDPDRYVDEVLADAALDAVWIELYDPAYLPLLPRLRRLRRLCLPPGTPAGPLAELLSAPPYEPVRAGLTELDLGGTPLADATPLAGLPALAELDLRGTLVADISVLAGLGGLRRLTLAGTAVADIRPLAGLHRLARLDLSSTPVTDLGPLAGLSGLRELWLFRSQVTDLAPVSGIAGLEVAVLPPQVERLRATLGEHAQCKVVTV